MHFDHSAESHLFIWIDFNIFFFYGSVIDILIYVLHTYHGHKTIYLLLNQCLFVYFNWMCFFFVSIYMFIKYSIQFSYVLLDEYYCFYSFSSFACQHKFTNPSSKCVSLNICRWKHFRDHWAFRHFCDLNLVF